jgi:hypothetical protein
MRLKESMAAAGRCGDAGTSAPRDSPQWNLNKEGDKAFQMGVTNHAAALVEMVRQIRSGCYQRPDPGQATARKK